MGNPGQYLSLTARRFVEIGEWPHGMRLLAAANEVASPEDEAYLKAEPGALDVPLRGTVPTNLAVARAERDGLPLVTLDPGTPARRAGTSFVDRLRGAAGEQPVAVRVDRTYALVGARKELLTLGPAL